MVFLVKLFSLPPALTIKNTWDVRGVLYSKTFSDMSLINPARYSKHPLDTRLKEKTQEILIGF